MPPTLLPTLLPLPTPHCSCNSLKLLDTDALRVESLRRLKGEAEGEGQRRKVVVSGQAGLKDGSGGMHQHSWLVAGLLNLAPALSTAPGLTISPHQTLAAGCVGAQAGGLLRTGGVLPRPVR